MKNAKFKTIILGTTLALVSPGLVFSEVVHRQINADDLVVSVKNDDWQPEGFENGTNIPAAYIGVAGITLDGRDDEIFKDMMGGFHRFGTIPWCWSNGYLPPSYMAPRRDQFHQQGIFIFLDAKTRLERFHKGNRYWMKMDRLNCDRLQVNLPVEADITMDLEHDTTIFSRIVQMMVRHM